MHGGYEDITKVALLLTKPSQVSGDVLLALAREWGIGILDVDSIVRYREEHRISFVTGTPLPTADASFRLLHYRDTMTWQDYLVLTLGDLQKQTMRMLKNMIGKE